MLPEANAIRKGQVKAMIILTRQCVYGVDFDQVLVD
jgi:hypothetical protein